MRKIIAVNFITLDGVMQAPGGPDEDRENGFKYGGWLAPLFDEQGGKEMAKQMKPPFDLLLGRKTYEIFATYWPKHKEDWPGSDTATKYAVSRTLENPSWKTSVVLRDEKEVKKLKAKKGNDLHVYGSGNLLQTLFKNDLVDELWLKIFPVTIGSGKKLFEDGTIPAAFKLLKSKITPSGVIFAYYKRAGKLKTGSVGS